MARFMECVLWEDMAYGWMAWLMARVGTIVACMDGRSVSSAWHRGLELLHLPSIAWETASSPLLQRYATCDTTTTCTILSLHPSTLRLETKVVKPRL